MTAVFSNENWWCQLSDQFQQSGAGYRNNAIPKNQRKTALKMTILT